MMSRNQELRRYYHQIRGWLPCGGQQKQRIMERIKANVDAYLTDHPEADFEQIQSRFGAPREISAAYVEDLNTGELLAVLRVRRRIVAAVCMVVAFVLLSWGAHIIWATAQAEKTFGGQLSEGIMEGMWPTDDGGELDPTYVPAAD